MYNTLSVCSSGGSYSSILREKVQRRVGWVFIKNSLPIFTRIKKANESSFIDVFYFILDFIIFFKSIILNDLYLI